MAIRKGLCEFLAADTGVQAALGNPARIYASRPRQGAAKPYAKVALVADVPFRSLRTTTARRALFQVEVYAEGQTAVVSGASVVAAIRAAIGDDALRSTGAGDSWDGHFIYSARWMDQAENWEAAYADGDDGQDTVFLDLDVVYKV